MDFYKIGGLAITAIIVTLGLIKIELIKEVVKKITSDKEKVNLFAILLLIIISVIPSIVGFNIPNDNSENQTTEVQQTPKEKSDLEAGLEIGKAVLTSGKELYEEHKTNKERGDSIFLAKRPQRLVYQIGDVMDNNESVLEFYKKLKNTDNICLFKNKKYFFFFKNIESTKKQLNDSLDSFESQIGSLATVIDLMTYCTSSKDKIIKTKSQKYGRRKDRMEIDCYTVDK